MGVCEQWQELGRYWVVGVMVGGSVYNVRGVRCGAGGTGKASTPSYSRVVRDVM